MIKKLQRRILDISYSHGLSHLSSNLCALPIIYEIFQQKKNGEKFVLSSGHAGLALYVVLEYFEGLDAEKLLERCGIHPERGEGIDCSTGSLGMGIGIACGMAMADRSKAVYCLISDGEAKEGSVYEAFNLKKKYSLDNLIVYLNHNGYGAYGETVNDYPFDCIVVDTSYVFKDFTFLNGQEGHYIKLTKETYEESIFRLSAQADGGE